MTYIFLSKLDNLPGALYLLIPTGSWDFFMGYLVSHICISLPKRLRNCSCTAGTGAIMGVMAPHFPIGF